MDAINEKIIEKLKKYNIGKNYNELKPHTQKLLNEIEHYMSNSFQQRLQAIDILKNKKININNIIANTNISKGTIYNNPNIFKKYIDESIAEHDEIEKKEYNLNKNEDILKANSELKQVVDELTIELINMNNLKLINEKLISENKALRKENDVLIDERTDFATEIRNYQKQIKDLIKNGNNIIPIKQE